MTAALGAGVLSVDAYWHQCLHESLRLRGSMFFMDNSGYCLTYLGREFWHPSLASHWKWMTCFGNQVSVHWALQHPANREIYICMYIYIHTKNISYETVFYWKSYTSRIQKYTGSTVLKENSFSWCFLLTYWVSLTPVCWWQCLIGCFCLLCLNSFSHTHIHCKSWAVAFCR